MGPLLQLIFYAALIALAVAAVIAGGSIVISIGVIYGAGISVYNYFLSLIENFKFEKPTPALKSSGEPAIKNYIYEKGFNDLLGVIKETWAKNLKSIDENKTKMQTSKEIVYQIMYGASFVSIFLFGTLFFALISIFHFLVLGILYAVLYSFFSIVWFVEKIYMHIHQYFAACPHCHTKSILPEYLCDKCGAVHTQLMPNKYGIFFHTCKCGNKLPSTFFLNRGSLQARCTKCHQYLEREHVESKRLFIPILGGPSVGKTTFMFSAVNMFIEKTAAELGYTAEFMDKNTEAKYKKTVQDMKNGYLPAKTVDNLPKAFNLALKKDNQTNWLFYIYDPAGEAYTKIDHISLQKYNEYVSGMIFMIDPFSLLSVKEKYETRLSQGSISPSALSVNDALSRVLSALEESFGLSKTAKFKKPFAVVISKVDALDNNEIIFQSKSKKREDTHSQIKLQLEEWGEYALLQQLETRFTNFRFFLSSSLQNSNENMRANATIDPILWIGNSVSKENFSLNEDKKGE